MINDEHKEMLYAVVMDFLHGHGYHPGGDEMIEIDSCVEEIMRIAHTLHGEREIELTADQCEAIKRNWEAKEK